MNTAGIIAEYNPFHNGHAYQIRKTREMTGCDYLIVVMSGDFTQRGAPAITDKYTRAEMALQAGADLVLELPVLYASASAETFALGAVSLLDKLGVTDTLSFGSECGKVTPLLHAAQLLIEEPPSYLLDLKALIKAGNSYPKARALSLIRYGIDPELIQSPNNILGIEYCKALLRLSSGIKPMTIKRKGSGFHETALADSPNTSEAYSSASAIRSISEGFSSAEELNKLASHLPAASLNLLKKNLAASFPVTADDFSLLLHYQLLTKSVDELSGFLDINSDLADKIKKNLRCYEGFSSFAQQLKSKDLTQTRINRSLLHILLNIKKTDLQEQLSSSVISYARILGFHKSATPLLNAIKKRSSVPLISKLANAHRLLPDHARSMLELDLLAAGIYDSVLHQKFGITTLSEYEKKLRILS